MDHDCPNSASYSTWDDKYLPLYQLFLLKWGLVHFLLMLAWNHNPPYLYLLSS
jgi:hypothetical protein